MDIENRVEKQLSAIFAIVGTVLFIVGIALGIIISSKRQNMELCNAVISDIKREGDSYTAYVSYEYKGEAYDKIRLNEYSSSMRVGDVKKIYVNPVKPKDISGTFPAWLLALIFCGFSCVFSGIGYGMIIKRYKKNKKKRRLFEANNYVTGEVDRVEMNRYYSVNNRHPFVLYAKYKDPYTGIEYEFRSDNLWDGMCKTVDRGSGVRVYVNPQDYNDYYVDVQSIFSVLGEGSSVY